MGLFRAGLGTELGTPLDPYLQRLNQSLRAAGWPVAIELTRSGQRIRLRATMPDSTGTWRQQRVSTRLLWPDGIDAARAMAEQLGRDLRLARMGDPFPHDRWLAADRPLAPGEAISGSEALRHAERHWQSHSRRASPTGWAHNYGRFLQPLEAIPALEPRHLRALVERHSTGSSIRHHTAGAAAFLAQAAGFGAELAADLRALGSGYSASDAAPRDLPTDAVIETVIDGLSPGWQWVAGVCATYGARPSEAILHAAVQPSGLLAISAGKTGSRQSLPLPRAWIERWDLHRLRRPGVKLERSNSGPGERLSRALRRAGAPFRGYDLRHAWAVRAILHPQISPSLAAKSMGHSLAIHSRTYQRWFDQSSMLGVLEEL